MLTYSVNMEHMKNADVALILDWFELKRYQKKRYLMGYKSVEVHSKNSLIILKSCSLHFILVLSTVEMPFLM